MTVTLYPVAYGREMVPMVEMRRRYEAAMHPAFADVLFPYLESKGGDQGIGSSLRLVQPQKPGFAPGNMSFHLRQRFASGLVVCSAVDLVHVNPGKVHRAPTWAEVPRQGSAEAAFHGFHCNTTTETWHGQHEDQDGFQSWLNAGRPDPRMLNKLAAGGVPPVFPSTPTPDPTLADLVAYADHLKGQTPPGAPQWPQFEGMAGPDANAYALQRMVNEFAAQNPAIPTCTADGWFGPMTKAAVAAFQVAYLGLPGTGVYDEASFVATQTLSNNLYALTHAAAAAAAPDPAIAAAAAEAALIAEWEARTYERLGANQMPEHVLSMGDARNVEVYLLQSILQDWATAEPDMIPTPGRADGEFGRMTFDSLNALKFHHLGLTPAEGVFYDAVCHLKLQALADALHRMKAA